MLVESFQVCYAMVKYSWNRLTARLKVKTHRKTTPNNRSETYGILVLNIITADVFLTEYNCLRLT